MDIRTKLVFALVALALGSMLALGAFMYASAGDKLDDLTTSQLEAIAVSSEAAIDEVLAGWRERVQLIASRTQLRLSLREYERSSDAAELGRIDRILTDALGSVESLLALGVYNDEGRLVTSVGESVPGEVEPAAGQPLGGTAGAETTPPTEPRFLSAVVDESGQLHVSVAADLLLEDARLGELIVVLSGREIIELTQDFPGLGETGEILIVLRDDGGIRTLHPTRNPDGAERGILQIDSDDDPVIRALNREEAVFEAGFTNYRGAAVWAATRYIEETGWGVVVKFDDAEAQRSIDEFRTETVTLALSLSAFAILFAVLLGMRFATPIHQLAEVANRIRGGDLEARATVRREDEIGMLARDFNQMAEEMEARITELHRYRMFFELSLDLLCIANTDGYFERVNPAFERSLGWSTEDLLTRPFIDLVHPDDKQVTQAEIDKLARGIPTISFENRFRCADGTYRWLLWTSHPEPDGTLYASAREIDEPTATA